MSWMPEYSKYRYLNECVQLTHLHIGSFNYLEGLVNSQDNITEEVAAQEQAYEVIAQEIDVGGILTKYQNNYRAFYKVAVLPRF